MLTLNINLKLRASTQLTNYIFNSYCKIGNKFVACGDSRLCQIGSSTLPQESVNSIIRTFKTQLGHSASKRLRYFYLGIESDGVLKITATVDKQVLPTITYRPKSPIMTQVRLPVGRGIKGYFWDFKIENESGCWFSISEILVLPTLLSL
jgi:hypothetical protein